ncbi:MAG: DUF4446 family protein [Hyphomonadaceae bacterium]|nr:DUF4446 family protein [Clostridia bacterium]
MGFVLLLCGTLVYVLFKVRKLSVRYRRLTGRLGEKKVEDILLSYYEQTEHVSKLYDDVMRRTKALESAIKPCIQKVGMVRFNAYENVGSQLSFALAMLDENLDGVVLNSIHNRDSCAIYMKPIVDGKSEFALSEEEKQAIALCTKKQGKGL